MEIIVLKYRPREPARQHGVAAANDGAESTAQELLAAALEARVNRIARDLARDTGKPVRYWLEQAAKMLCPQAGTHLIVDVEDGPMFAVRRPSRS